MAKLTVVTGAAGFIGRNTVAALNARGADHILMVDRLGSDHKWTNLLGLRFEDLIDPDQFRNRVETSDGNLDVDAIVHLGACSSTTERDADFLLRNNYQYTRMLCQWALAHGVRFIYASSGATYGDGSAGYSDDDSVTPTLRPLNMYGYSKHLFDLWAIKNQLQARIVGLKYFNVFGPNEDFKGEMRSVVQKSFHQIKKSGEVSLFKSYRSQFKDGEQKRDFVYVNDAVDVTLHFLEHRDKGGIFNCGTGEARTWKDLALAVFAAMGVKPNIKFIEMPEAMRQGYQYFTQADISKLRKSGYTRPFTRLQDAVGDYVRNYLAKKP